MTTIQQVPQFYDTFLTAKIVGLTFADVAERLGFNAMTNGGDWKVTHEWYCTVDGARLAVWDYKGSPNLSAWGPIATLKAVFGDNHVTGSLT